MKRATEFILGGIPMSPAATHALAATMADWRHEAALARTARVRMRVATMGALSVIRVLVVSSIRELPAAWSAPFLWRTAALSCIVVLGAIWYDPPLVFVDVLPTRDLIVLALFRAAPAAVILLPIAAFFSEASGSRTRVGPTAGALTAMAGIAAVAIMLYPEFVHYERHAAWEQFANAATPAPLPQPSLFRFLSGGETIPMTRTGWISFGAGILALAATTVSLSVLAFQVRQSRSNAALALGVTPFVSAMMTWGVGLLLARAFSGTNRDVFTLYAQVAGLLVFLSVTALPLMLAGYLARQMKRGDSRAGSVVTT